VPHAGNVASAIAVNRDSFGCPAAPASRDCNGDEAVARIAPGVRFRRRSRSPCTRSRRKGAPSTRPQRLARRVGASCDRIRRRVASDERHQDPRCRSRDLSCEGRDRGAIALTESNHAAGAVGTIASRGEQSRAAGGAGREWFARGRERLVSADRRLCGRHAAGRSLAEILLIPGPGLRTLSAQRETPCGLTRSIAARPKEGRGSVRTCRRWRKPPSR